MCPFGRHTRLAEKLRPFHATMFSPPFLISRPAPSLRYAHATRLVTSKAPSGVCGGFNRSWMHWTTRNGSPPTSPPQPSSGSAADGLAGADGAGAGGGGVPAEDDPW